MMIDVWRVMYRRMMSGGLCRVLLCVGLGFGMSRMWFCYVEVAKWKFYGIIGYIVLQCTN